MAANKMMDTKLNLFIDRVVSLVGKLEMICTLATELQLSNQITDNLELAKISLNNCKVFLDVEILQTFQVPDLTTAGRNTQNDEHDVGEDLPNQNKDLKSCDSTDEVIDFVKQEVKMEPLNNIDFDNASFDDGFHGIEAKVEIDDIDDESQICDKIRKQSSSKKKKTIETEKRNCQRERNECTLEPDDIEYGEDNNTAIDEGSFINENLNENDETSFVCNICGKAKANKSHLIYHVNFHNRKSKCPLCPAVVRNFEMKKHKDEKHKTQKASKQQCRHCYKSFPEEEFKIHSVTCIPIQVQCTVCGKVCNGRKNHSDHMRIHTRSYDFSCGVCDRKYRTEGEMLRHKKCSHLNVRTCDICGASIKGDNTLKQHMLTHSDDRERSFPCDECNKSFYVASSLKKHKKTHSEERPYSCDICIKSFKYKEILINHMRKHNKDEFFKCEECGKSFSFKSALKKHLRRIHKVVKKYSEIS